MFGALLTDLSKTFDCLPHDIIIAKLNAYGSDMKPLNFIYDCLENRTQRTKIDNAYSSGKTYCMELLKDRFWDRYYLT